MEFELPLQPAGKTVAPYTLPKGITLNNTQQEQIWLKFHEIIKGNNIVNAITMQPYCRIGIYCELVNTGHNPLFVGAIAAYKLIPKPLEERVAAQEKKPRKKRIPVVGDSLER